jgi:hypothetical protein
MEFEKLKEIIETTKVFKTNPACEKLAEHFQALAELHFQHKDGIVNEDYFEAFGTHFKAFWDSFDKAVESLGFSAESLKANLNNPEFFHPEQWKAMQAIRQEISGEKPEGEIPKKIKRLKKSVRI